jgi:hypothetical protein
MILATDFDGVMHPDPWHSEKQLWRHMAAFADLLREPALSRVELLITSSWRVRDVVRGTLRAQEEIERHFPVDLRPRIVGMTPCLGQLGEGLREMEIRAWLDAAGRSGSRWVAVDDRPYLFSGGAVSRRHLVLTDSARGLDGEAIGRLRTKLLTWQPGE